MTHKSSYSNPQLLAAIDLGSSRCTTLIASRDAQSGECKIVGMGQIPSKGMRRSTIINLEEAAATIERSVAAAEKICGHNIDNVYLSVSGKHIDSQNSQGTVVIVDANSEIHEEDVDRSIEQARTLTLSADREVLNLIPRFFTVDGHEGIKDPIGMVGMKLETHVHLITASSSALRNLEKALSDINLNVEAFVFSGFAASEVVLSEDEKDAGVICIDIGADTTSFCVYSEGAIQFSGVVPIGGRYITQDINAYIHLGLENAEKIKIELSNQTPPEPRGADESLSEYHRRMRVFDSLDLTKYDPSAKARGITKSTLIRDVIAPRVKEIFTLISDELKKRKIGTDLGAGAVIVGGSARTICLRDIASEVLNMQVRLGVPKEIKGVIRHLDDPSYATAVGLLKYAAGASNQLATPTENTTDSKKDPWGNFFKQLSQSVKKLMP